MNDEITLTLTDFSTGEKTVMTTGRNGIRTGTVKRIFSLFDLDKMIADSKTPGDFMAILTAGILVAYPAFEAEILNMFPGVTKEDLEERTTISDMADTVAALIGVTLENLGHVSERLKKKVFAGA